MITNERLSGETSGLSDTSCGAKASHLTCSIKVTKEIFKKTHMYFHTMCTCSQDTPQTVSDTHFNPTLLSDDLHAIQAASVSTPTSPTPRPCCPTCEILVPPPGTEPGLPTLEAQSINHWTVREVLNCRILTHHQRIFGFPLRNIRLTSSSLLPHHFLLCPTVIVIRRILLFITFITLEK